MNIIWAQSSPFPNLSLDDAHVWLADLRKPDEVLLRMQNFLMPEEKLRAAKFLQQEAKRNFILVRGALRCLLAKYLHCIPQEIQFSQNEHGKLFLPQTGLEFNLSHSKDFALFAFAWKRPLGVDIEFMRPALYAEDVARKFFAAKEIASLFALPEEQRKVAFFQCWSRKEAFIKALGVGIFYPLDQFVVDVDTGQSGPITLQINAAKDKAHNWQLIALQCVPNYAAALCIAGEIQNLLQFNYDFGAVE